MTCFDDVTAFNEKFRLPISKRPTDLPVGLMHDRIRFLAEELVELTTAAGMALSINPLGPANYRGIPESLIICGHEVNVWATPQAKPRLADEADALIDLVYVAMGTAVMMGLPWQALWDDVQRANLAKVRGSTKRGMAWDLAKPPGWVPPRTKAILEESA